MATGQPTPILGVNYLVTGVRQWEGSEVVLTGAYVGDGAATAILYVGPIEPGATQAIYRLEPQIDGQQVTSSTFYGPDSWIKNPGLGAGNVRAVGSYQYQGGSARNHGMIYHGPPSGGGSWTQLDVPDSVAGGTVWNTIAHSTMGDLIVGNFDIEDQPASANAFVYDMARNRWTAIELKGCDLTTAYGIWQNGVGSDSYTIAGGTRDGQGINRGFVIDYAAASGRFGNFTLYSYPAQPGLLTHFEGITESTTSPSGYHLAGQAFGAALFASIDREKQGFGPASWTPFTFPSAVVTTGNTVYQDALMGVALMSGTKDVQSYAVKIAP